MNKNKATNLLRLLLCFIFVLQTCVGKSIQTKNENYRDEKCYVLMRILSYDKTDYTLEFLESYINNIRCYTSHLTHMFQSFLIINNPLIIPLIEDLANVSKDAMYIYKYDQLLNTFYAENTIMIIDHDDYVDPKFFVECCLSKEENVTYRLKDYMVYYPNERRMFKDKGDFLPTSQLGICVKPNDFPSHPPKTAVTKYGHPGHQHNIIRLNYTGYYVRNHGSESYTKRGLNFQKSILNFSERDEVPFYDIKCKKHQYDKSKLEKLRNLLSKKITV